MLGVASCRKILKNGLEVKTGRKWPTPEGSGWRTQTELGISSHLTLPVALETDTAGRNQSLRGAGFGFASGIACVEGILIVGLGDFCTWALGEYVCFSTLPTPIPTCYLVWASQCRFSCLFWARFHRVEGPGAGGGRWRRLAVINVPSSFNVKLALSVRVSAAPRRDCLG